MEEITIANVCFGVPEEDGKIGYAPLGPLYLTSSLEKAGYPVVFKDYLASYAQFDNPVSFQSILTFLKESSNLMFISCNSGTLPFVVRAVEEIKRLAPEKTIIVGGLGPTSVAKKLLETFSAIDIVIRGEGERTTLQLVEHLHTDLSRVQGITYRNGNHIMENPAQTRIQNLDTLPLPAYEKIDLNQYSIVGISTSRGCAFNCTFCGEEYFWGTKNVRRSADSILQELELLYDKYGQQKFEFVDDTFLIDRERVLDFCKKFRARGMDIEWSINGVVNLLDDELIRELSISGCKQIFLGIESGSNRILKLANKHFTIQQAKEIIAKSLDGPDIIASFIWGFPYETMEDLYQTLEAVSYVADAGTAFWLFPLTPIAKSELYEEYKHHLKFFDETVEGDFEEDIIALIKRYPAIFPGYYYYDADNFDARYKLVKEFEAVDYTARSVFLEGLIIPRSKEVKNE